VPLLIDTPIFIVDTETTGLDPREHSLCEIAAIRWDPTMSATVPAENIWSTLVHPGRSIPAVATAVHGIRDSDVRRAPSVAEAVERFNAIVPAEALVIAHNLSFDSRFLPLGDRLRTCTLRLARATWPEAPSHANAKLASWLRIDITGIRTHRATADTLITLGIFNTYLREMERRNNRLPTVEELTQLKTSKVSTLRNTTNSALMAKARLGH
jgi:DNA polymerase-3 subunit epsilon